MESSNIKFCILIPSRNRVQLVKEALKNILEKTYNLDNVKILLGIDDDDENSINLKIPEEISSKINIKKVIMERKLGYEDQPWRLSEMIKNTNCDFYVNYADDMKIINKYWDKNLTLEINKLPKDRIYLIYPSHNQKNINWPLCQIISKDWFLATGKFTNYFETDTELMIISGILNRKYKIKSMEITHKYNEEGTNDKTFIEGRAKTLKYKYNNKSILSITSLFKVFIDCEILKNKINSKSEKKIVNIIKVIFLFLPRVYWINKIYKINYFKIFIKNIFYLKI